eukprot:SM000047S16856  [mRNA]  locus=s47:339551:341206:- [translate_table: standard]
MVIGFHKNDVVLKVDPGLLTNLPLPQHGSLLVFTGDERFDNTIIPSVNNVDDKLLGPDNIPAYQYYIPGIFGNTLAPPPVALTRTTALPTTLGITNTGWSCRHGREVYPAYTDNRIRICCDQIEILNPPPPTKSPPPPYVPPAFFVPPVTGAPAGSPTSAPTSAPGFFPPSGIPPPFDTGGSPTEAPSGAPVFLSPPPMTLRSPPTGPSPPNTLLNPPFVFGGSNPPPPGGSSSTGVSPPPAVAGTPPPVLSTAVSPPPKTAGGSSATPPPPPPASGTRSVVAITAAAAATTVACLLAAIAL